MNWVIILYHLMSAFLGCGSGLMVVVVMGSIFEQITGYCPQDVFESSQAEREQELRKNLTRDIEEIKTPSLLYELELLIAARRMVNWWKMLVFFIVASVVYYEVVFKW